MAETRQPELSQLRIDPTRKTRRRAGPLAIVVLIALLVVVGVPVFFATRHADRQPVPAKSTSATASRATTAGAAPAPNATAAPAAAPKSGEVVLTVSGYVIPHARIELSPRFQGTVKWIGVKKGDAVKAGQVIVQLEDDEYRARLLEAEGRLALATANLTNATINLQRQLDLARSNVDSQQAVDEAVRARAVAAAEVTAARGTVALAQTYLDWCTIRAPIDGVILEKLVDPNELVVPQSFGGARGPSTALVAMADLNDLQVEIDLNESDTPKVHLGQQCRVSPEAYPEKKYTARVAEIAPEANRQKGTLQVKVQVENPDRFLTPELTAKVDFLAD